MKKIFTILSVASCAAVFGQCNISGKSNINILSEETYTYSDNAAQCKDCHLWVTVGGNAKILNESKQNTIKLKAENGGRQILSLTVLTPQGIVQCSKNIDINNENGSLPAQASTQTNNCDVDVNNFKEVKVADNIVSFFPNGAGNYNYTWTAQYTAGSSQTSTEKIPQFPYSKDNGISKISVKVVSSKCLREFSKTYDSNYWRFF